MTSFRWIIGIAAYFLLVIWFAATIWSYAFHDGLDRLSERGQSDLTLAADRLSGQLLRYRELAVVLSKHPDFRAALITSADTKTAQDLVVAMADMTGAKSIALVDTSGAVIVSSAPEAPPFDADKPPVSRALNGALGAAHEVITGSAAAPRRIFSFAAPVLGRDGLVAGALVTKVDVERFEENWPSRAPAVLFSDTSGRVIATNRSGLILSNRKTGENYPSFHEKQIGQHILWTFDGDRYLPSRALYLQRSLPVIDLYAEILLDTATTERSAYLQAAISAALLLVFGVLIFLVVQHSRNLRLRLVTEAEQKESLEKRVTERTRDLSEVNAELRREVKDRTQAEIALKKAQDNLVQAGKLNALGQMSAGISHELNQPLMAIRSFAENGTVLIDKNKPDVARENLSRISELARRMGRIIKNLRAFARQESGPITDVDLVQVVISALEVTADNIARSGVELNWQPPETAIMVRGGEVRLTQVVVNLIANATDAMVATLEKRIDITIDTDNDVVLLTVRDTGPGIIEPERMFEPFYSTKATGSAKGMGLGLSISYGLVQSFGGAIKGLNHPDGGAVFTVGLVPAKLKVAE